MPSCAFSVCCQRAGAPCCEAESHLPCMFGEGSCPTGKSRSITLRPNPCSSGQAPGGGRRPSGARRPGEPAVLPFVAVCGLSARVIPQAVAPLVRRKAAGRLGGGPALVHVQPEDGGQHQGAPGPAQRAEGFVPEQPDPDGAEDGLQIAEHGRADQPQPLEGLGIAEKGEITGESAQDQQPAPGGEAVVEADGRQKMTAAPPSCMKAYRVAGV